MFDTLARIGEVTVGVISTLVWIFIILAGLIELFDWITGADKRKQEEKDHMAERLKSLEGGDS